MKLTIKEINIINIGLIELMDVKVPGDLKFKILRNNKKAEEVLNIAQEVINSNKDDISIFDKEEEIDFDKFTQEELRDLTISARTLLNIEKITKGDKCVD